MKIRRTFNPRLCGKNIKDPKQLEFPRPKTRLHKTLPEEYRIAEKLVRNAAVSKTTNRQLPHFPILQPKHHQVDGGELSNKRVEVTRHIIGRSVVIQETGRNRHEYIFQN